MRMGLNALVGAAASRWGLPVVGLYAAAEGYQYYQEDFAGNTQTEEHELNSKLARDLVGFTAGALVGSLVFNR